MQAFEHIEQQENPRGNYNAMSCYSWEEVYQSLTNCIEENAKLLKEKQSIELRISTDSEYNAYKEEQEKSTNELKNDAWVLELTKQRRLSESKHEVALEQLNRKIEQYDEVDEKDNDEYEADLERIRLRYEAEIAARKKKRQEKKKQIMESIKKVEEKKDILKQEHQQKLEHYESSLKQATERAAGKTGAKKPRSIVQAELRLEEIRKNIQEIEEKKKRCRVMLDEIDAKRHGK